MPTFWPAGAGISGFWAVSGRGPSSFMENEASESVAEVGHGGPAGGANFANTTDAIGLFSCPKTCSTQARTDDRVALLRRICLGIGLPLGFLRRIWDL